MYVSHGTRGIEVNSTRLGRGGVHGAAGAAPKGARETIRLDAPK